MSMRLSLRLAAILLLGAIVSVGGCAHGPRRPTISSGVAIIGSTVIDMTGDTAKPDMTVVVRDGRIVAIGPSETIALGPNVRRVDGGGRYLIPGLWDMHAHVAEYAPIWLPVMLANGITGVRNMHAVSVELTRQVAADTDSAKLPGPQFIGNGPLIDGSAGPWPTAVKVDTPEAAAKAVNDLHAAGADFIKVYSFLSGAAYFAIADKSKQRRIPFAGHVPQSISALEATKAGQHSIEHLDGLLMAAASDETDLRRRFSEASAAWRNPATSVEGRAAMIAVNRDLVAHYDERKASALFAAFVANDTYQTPTLVTHYTNIHRADPDILRNPALRYVPASVRKQWLSLPPPNPEMVASQQGQFTFFGTLLGALHRAGIRILAGTDTGGALIVPGDSLHRELALMVEAGLTPFQALETATVNAAAYFGKDASSGTIETGKRADFVMLERNPLADIGNTRTIAAVIRAGTVYDRAALDVMLAQAETSATNQ